MKNQSFYAVIITKRCLLFVVMLLFACSGTVVAQNVSGQVVDESGEGLIGATVSIVDESRGTATDAQGNFTLENVSDGTILKVSYTGYVETEISVDSRNLTITLIQGQTLGEIVITADKTENTLQKTGIAVTTISGLEMRETGLVSSEQVLRNVPNVVVQGAARGYVIAIRGLGSDLPPGVGESAVTTNFDGIYNFRAESGTLGFFDMNRVEVLRGPQGTLYGRNATGGVVNVITSDPVLNKFEGYGTVDVGNYSHLRFEGAINAPIGNKVAARVAFANVNRDGYLSNGSNDAVATGVRAKVRYKPSKKVDLVFAAEYNDLGGKGPGFVPIFSFSDPNVEDKLMTSLSPDVSQDYTSLKLWANLTFEAGPGVLTLLPSYQRGEGEVVGERMGMLSTSFDPNPALQTSFEARYASKPESKINWVFGLFYYGLDNKISGVPTPDAINNDKTNSTAGFGQITLPLSDKMRALAGVRFGSDKKSFEGPLSNIEDSFTAFDWKIGLETDLAKDILSYLTIATGHRPGGFNSFSPDAPRFESESLISGELGLKSRFKEKFQVNTALFYYNYNGYQVPDFFIPEGSPFPVLEITNRDVINYGIEVETKTLLSKNTVLGLALTYLSSKYNEDFILHGAPPPPPGPNDPPPNPNDPPPMAEIVDMNGMSLPHAPAFSFNASLEHTFILGNFGRLTPSVRYRWIDEQFVAPFPGTDQTQEAYGMLDANIKLGTKNGRWGLNLYGRNLTNEITKIAFFATDVIVGSPRQVGVSLTARF